MNKEIIKTKYGYFSIKNMPTEEELQRHYAEEYYQHESMQYSYKYSDDELEYFENRSKIAEYLFNKYSIKENNEILEVGAGEGFFASYFFKNNWNVTTLDYSDFGIKTHNKELLETLIKGDVFNSLDKLALQNKKYDFINLSNILEHVINPLVLLEKLKLLLTEKSVLRISVPNDYSEFQNFLLEKKYTLNSWLCPPDHLHYFTFETLRNLLISLNYKVDLLMGEFPIELYLTNEVSNYNKNKEVGKFAHKSRVEVDNYLFKKGFDKYINFYSSCADIGLSRQVVAYVKLEEKK